MKNENFEIVELPREPLLCRIFGHKWRVRTDPFDSLFSGQFEEIVCIRCGREGCQHLGSITKKRVK